MKDTNQEYEKENLNPNQQISNKRRIKYILLTISSVIVSIIIVFSLLFVVNYVTSKIIDLPQILLVILLISPLLFIILFASIQIILKNGNIKNLTTINLTTASIIIAVIETYIILILSGIAVDILNVPQISLGLLVTFPFFFILFLIYHLVLLNIGKIDISREELNLSVLKTLISLIITLTVIIIFNTFADQINDILLDPLFNVIFFTIIFTVTLRLLNSNLLIILSSFWNNLPRKTRNQLTSYAFLVPSFVSLILFVFIPLIFSFLMSLYDNPSAIELRFAFDFYSNLSNISWRNISDFFLANTETGKGIFFNSGIALIITGLLFIAYIFISYKFLLRIKKGTTNSGFRPAILILAILSALFVAPAIIFFVKVIIAIIPVFIKLPIEEYRIILTVSSDQFDFVRVLFNTVFWTGVCVSIHVILGIFLALLMNRDLPGQGFFRSIFILPWAIPSFVSAIIFRSFVFDRQRGFLGSFTKDADGTSSFSITVMDIIVLIIVFALIVLFFYIFQKLIHRYIKRAKEGEIIRSLTSIAIGLASIVFGIISLNILTLLADSVLEISFFSIFAYKIVDIPSITSTFWFTDYVYIFGIKFYMISFSAIITNIWLGVPFMMVSFLAALQSIPKDLYEAAEIDGAGSWTKFRNITLPLLKPTLMTVSLLGIIWTFNLFNVVYILSTNQNSLTDTNLYQIFVTFIYERFDQGFAGERDFSGASALSFVVFLMLVSFSLVYRKVMKAESIFEGEET